MARDPWLDNAKFALITLVVVGHSVGLVLVDETNLQVYTWIYLFHMPAFVMVSGYLSRSFTWDRDHLVGLTSTLLLPYLVFEAAMFSWREHLGQGQTGTVWLDPHWGMWYLVVLAMWRLATPLLRRHWVWLPLSVPLSLWAGTWELTLLDIPKAFAMLPFFLVGLHARPAWLPLLGRWWARVAAVAVLVALWQVAGEIDVWARVAFLWWDRSYATLGYADAESARIRLRLLGLGLVGALAVLALVPRRTNVLTGLGAATLVVYLFHGFGLRWLESSDLIDWTPDHPWLALVVAASGAISLTLLLASPWVSRWLRWAVDPVGETKHHRRRRQAAEPAGSAPDETHLTAGQTADTASSSVR